MRRYRDIPQGRQDTTRLGDTDLGTGIVSIDHQLDRISSHLGDKASRQSSEGVAGWESLWALPFIEVERSSLNVWSHLTGCGPGLNEKEKSS